MKKNKKIAPKKIIITKKGTSSNYTLSDITDTNETDDTTETSSISTEYSDNKNKLNNKKSKSKSKSPIEPKFTSIVQAKYKKPKEGSKQDKYTKDDIIKQLKGFIPLKTMEEKKILTQLPIFKTWIKYMNVDTKQFRIGGFLMKVQYPDYITLANTRTNVSWSVQLNNTIIFIRDPRRNEETETSTEYYDTDTYTYTDATDTVTETTTNKEIDMIKDKLYKLYLRGQLTTKK